MISLSISHQRQSQQADCLAACAKMILQYLHIPIAYPQLLGILETDQSGSSFSKLTNLELRLGVTIDLAQGDDTLAVLEDYLRRGLPLIAYVYTGELKSYWGVATNHAVVVSGLDRATVYLNDPYFDDAPKVVTCDEFILAWLEQDYWFAAIRLDTVSP